MPDQPIVPLLILVIEDEVPIANLLNEVLQEAGYHVVIAATGAAAMQLLESLSPAVITLDLGLPGMDGRTVLRLLRAQPTTRTIPIVIISAERTIEPALQAAVQAVIKKPFVLQELLTTVQRVLDHTPAE